MHSKDIVKSRQMSLMVVCVLLFEMVSASASSFTSMLLTSPEVPEDAVLMANDDGDCPIGYFHCNTTAQCVPQRMNCDGAADCDDNSDELNCVNDADEKYWDHLFRKQPFGQHDDIPIGRCAWRNANFSCPCRGNEMLCRFLQLTAIPNNLPASDVASLDLTGNNFPLVDEKFLQPLPQSIERLVLKFCAIESLAPFAFRKFSDVPVQELYLDENRILSLPNDLFQPGNRLRILILSGNRLESLHGYDFNNLRTLVELDLRGNRIETFNGSVFEKLINLQVLYLNENRIHYISHGMFPHLPEMHTLSMAHNSIAGIERGSFTFPRLRHLFLADNELTHIEDRTFCDLHQLQGLHLNGNKIASFDLHAFECLENLTSLLLTDNEFKTLDPLLLRNLSNLNYIYFSWFHLCRAALHVRVCEPRGDGISSTFHLLDNSILRGSVWIMATVAIVGNLLVLLGRYVYKSRSNVEHSLYLRHLAISDFLMGVYLAVIACADISFRGQYIIHEEAWRQSKVCAFAGFLSTLSCQSSILLLTLVTWDRLMSVTRPLKPRDTGKMRIAMRMFLLWGISFTLAAAPLFPFGYFGSHFYGTNGVCLSLHIHDPYAKGWEYSAILFIIVNFCSLIFIAVSYMRMLHAIRNSGGAMRSTLSGRENVVATRFAIIVTTDCACWLPVIAVKLAALAGCPISPDLYAWLAVLVLPVNSALNPILYTLTTAAFKQQFLRYCQALPSCALILDSHTPNTFESGLSMSLGHFGGSGGGGGSGGSGSRNASERSKRFFKRRLSFV